MTLVSSGAITCGNINVELGKAETALINMTDANVVTLAGRAMAYQLICMSDFYGKTWGVPCAAFIAPSSTMPGFGWANLAYATDGNASTYATLVAGVNSYGSFITEALTCNKSHVSATVTWSSTVTGSGSIWFDYSKDNGTTWIRCNTGVKSSSWGTTNEALFTNILVSTPCYLKFRIAIYPSSGSSATVYLNGITVAMV